MFWKQVLKEQTVFEYKWNVKGTWKSCFQLIWPSLLIQFNLLIFLSERCHYRSMLVSTVQQALGFRQQSGKLSSFSLPFPVFFPQTSTLKTLVFKQWHSENLRCKGIGYLKGQQVNMIGWRNNPESTDAEYKKRISETQFSVEHFLLVTCQSHFSDGLGWFFPVPDKASGLWVFFSLTVP